MKKRVLYSGFKWHNIDKNSGYQQIVPKDSDYVNGNDLPGGKASFRSIKNRLNFILIDIITVIRGVNYDVVFVFHPEHTIYISPFVLSLFNVKVVYAIHMDLDFWFSNNTKLVMRLKRWQMKFVHRFIVMSRVQLTSFQDHFPGKASFIPHGVWCRSKYVAQTQGSFNVLVVGNSYRDYKLLEETCKLFACDHPRVVFDLIGINIKEIGWAKSLSNVVLRTRLSNQEYYQTLSEAEFIFLPLTFAAANNALLEGMSIGLPVYCNNVRGVLDYLPSSKYVVSGPRELSEIFSQRLQLSEEERIREGLELREHTLRNFDWSVVRDKVADHLLNL